MLRWRACGSLLLALWAWSAASRGADPALETSEPLAKSRPTRPPDLASKQSLKPDPSRERGAVSTAAASDAAAERIRGWIKDLDSEKFAVREAATEQLLKTGRAAIDALAAAVESKSPEVNLRAMRILEELYEATDTATRSAAQKALAAIAANPASFGAKRANE